MVQGYFSQPNLCFRYKDANLVGETTPAEGGKVHFLPDYVFINRQGEVTIVDGECGPVLWNRRADFYKGDDAPHFYLTPDCIPHDALMVRHDHLIEDYPQVQEFLYQAIPELSAEGKPNGDRFVEIDPNISGHFGPPYEDMYDVTNPKNRIKSIEYFILKEPTIHHKKLP